MAYDIGKIQRIYLGVQGEYASRPLEFNVQPWLDEFPEGSISIYHLRNGLDESYPVATEMDREEGVLYWTPTIVDTQYKGRGWCQFRLTQDGVVRKTRNIPTEIDPALPGTMSEDVPPAIEPYVDTIEEFKNASELAKEGAVAAQSAAEAAKTAAETAKDDAEDAARRAAESSAHAPYIGENHHWFLWDAEQEQYVDTGVKAEGQDGEPGDDGVSPEVTVSEIEGGHQIKVTDKTHPSGQTFEVMDGVDGEVPIDDTTPAADKVYSSQKVASEVSQLNQAIVDLQTEMVLKATKAELDATKARLKETERRTHLLEEAAIDKLYTDETVTETSYQQTVPSWSLSNAVLGMYGGKSIVWNQLSNGTREDSTVSSGITFTKNRNGTTRIYSDALSISSTHIRLSKDSNITFKKGHKYLIYWGTKNLVGSLSIGSNITIASDEILASKEFLLYTRETLANGYIGLGVSSTESYSVDATYYIIQLDLTTMGLDDIVSDADERIPALIKYAKDHPEYNAGEIVSADVNGFESAGSNHLDISSMSVGKIESDGHVDTSTVYKTSDFIKVRTGDVIYTDNRSSARLALYDNDKQFVLYSTTYGGGSAGYTSTVDGYVRATWTAEQIGAGQSYVNIGTNVGYAPYHQPVSNPIPAAVLSQYPLRSAGSVYDTITYEPTTVDGVTVPKWKHTQNVLKKILDGSEDWATVSGNAPYRLIVNDWKANEATQYTVPDILCAEYESASVGSSWASFEKMVSHDSVSQKVFKFRDTTVSSLDDFKAKLSQDPITVYYSAETPVVTDITELMEGWDGILEVEEGGTITFKQVGDSIFAIPNTVNYLVKTTGGA